MTLLVNPVGNFPLNDDWVYGRAAQSIVVEKNFNLLGGNTSANIITQAMWGAIFCLPFGFSFTALRISTLVLGLLGILATYALLREAKVIPGLALLGSCLVMFNPIYFGLSYTYMTDIPFFAAASWSIYFLIRGIRRSSRNDTLFGILLSYVALLVRQNGIFISFAFAFADIVQKKLSLKSLAQAFSPALLGLLIQFAYTKWLIVTHRTSPNLNLQVKGLLETLATGDPKIISAFIYFSLVALVYLGVFTFLFTIIPFFNLSATNYSQKRRALPIGLTILFSLLAGVCFLKGLKMPILALTEINRGHILEYFGLGPLTLHDTAILNINLPSIPGFLEVTWVFVTIAGIIGATLLLYYAALAIWQIKQKKFQNSELRYLKSQLVFALALAITYYAPLGVSGYFDRYLIFLIPVVMLFIAIATSIHKELSLDSGNTLNQKAVFLIIAIILFFGGFTVGATHDYLAWNRTRWQALNELITEYNVPINHIDGGYEFNGWYLYSPTDTDAINFRQKANTNKSWWYVDRDDYIVTFGPLDQYEVLSQYPLNNWLSFSPNHIFVLHKQS
ncbi:MAG: glycosyltransferase family 39 protein [Elainellaceae cyanobacterium]